MVVISNTEKVRLAVQVASGLLAHNSNVTAVPLAMRSVSIVEEIIREVERGAQIATSDQKARFSAGN